MFIRNRKQLALVIMVLKLKFYNQDAERHGDSYLEDINRKKQNNYFELNSSFYVFHCILHVNRRKGKENNE